jgi:hypothetical protein
LFFFTSSKQPHIGGNPSDNVGYGSEADMTGLHWDVGFAPESGH